MFVGVVALAGCGAEGPGGVAGSVDLNLEVAPGINLEVVQCEITGPEDVSVDISVDEPGENISLLKAGLPPGDYNVTCTSTSVEGDTECEGSNDFSIVTGETTMVMLDLLCTQEDDSGDVIVVGEVDICPGTGNVIATPLQTGTNNSLDVSIDPVDADDDTTPPVMWSNDCGGTFGDAAALATQFTCPAMAGPCTLSVAVGDEECGDSFSFDVECVGVGLCEGVDCDDDNECTADSCDPETGECSNEPTPGAECTIDGETGVCSADGVCENLCAGVDCDDGNECTADSCEPTTGECLNEPTPGADCTVEGMAGTCSADGVCEVAPEDPDPITQDIPVACRNSFNQQLSELPLEVTVDPLDPIEADAAFSADVSASLGLGQEFLQSAADELATFGLTLEEVTVNTGQAEIGVEAGATGPSVLSTLPGTPGLVVALPLEPGTEGMIPSQIAGDLVLDLSTETETYTAGPSGETVAFCPQGSVPDMVAVDDEASGTYVEVSVGVLNVDFACELGTVDDMGTPDDITDDVIVPVDPLTSCITIPVP